jgi:release factor glutamine methyltransferase
MDEVDGTFDLLVSNPPYIANDFAIDKNLTFEPSNALFGGIKGHEMLYDIIDIWQQRAIKHIACEMGYDQKNIILQKLPQANFYQDLAGFDRGFIAKNYKGFV